MKPCGKKEKRLPRPLRNERFGRDQQFAFRSRQSRTKRAYNPNRMDKLPFACQPGIELIFSFSQSSVW